MEGLIHRRGIANKESSEKRMRKKMPLEKGAFAESMEIVLINRSRFGLHHWSLKFTTGHAGGKTNITRFWRGYELSIALSVWAKAAIGLKVTVFPLTVPVVAPEALMMISILSSVSQTIRMSCRAHFLIRGGDSVGARVTDF